MLTSSLIQHNNLNISISNVTLHLHENVNDILIVIIGNV